MLKACLRHDVRGGFKAPSKRPPLTLTLSPSRAQSDGERGLHAFGLWNTSTAVQPAS